MDVASLNLLIRQCMRICYVTCVPARMRVKINLWLFWKKLIKSQPREQSRSAVSSMHSPPKLTLLGPYQSACGLGVASAGYLKLLSNLPFLLNTIPVRIPPIPSSDLSGSVLKNFDGIPDVSILHLNPENWPFFLEPAMLKTFLEARLRIAIWVWECSVVPDDWIKAFQYVDVIWVPSHYCAAICRRYTQLPVFVVPHTVSLPDIGDVPSQREFICHRFGFPADAKIILYVFDGSSLLLRKNPWSLIKAFANSKLKERGWVLVLKTKNMDVIPSQGKSLREAVSSTPAAYLFEDIITEVELLGLFSACHIYASPHCSEGFGLTVAEAMAAEKHVVATDFGGTTDFLNNETGYPVSYNLTKIKVSIGPYKAGSEWAQVDESDLAMKLCQAAADIEAGCFEKPRRARQRIAELLSEAAIRKTIVSTLQQLGVPV